MGKGAETAEVVEGKKRIFIILLALSLLLLVALAALFLFLAVFREGMLAFWINMAAMMAIAAAFLFCGTGIVSMVLSLSSRRPPGKVGRFFIRMALGLHPLAFKIGHLFRISDDSMWTSFVELNNRLVWAAHVKYPAERILVLLPHCLQRSECEKKVTHDISQCVGCGRCDIAGLRKLCDSLGVHAAVSTGGTLARQTVLKFRPKAVVAVACGRDLFSGIMDIRPLPTLGVLNERPEGPCHNTRVDVDKVEYMLRHFLAETKNTEETHLDEEKGS